MKNEHHMDLTNFDPQVIGGDMNAVQVITNEMRMKNYEKFIRSCLGRNCSEGYMVSKLIINDNWIPHLRNFDDECPNKMSWVLAKEKNKNDRQVALNIQHFYIDKTATTPEDPELAMRYNDVTKYFNAETVNRLNEHQAAIEDDVMTMEEIEEHLEKHDVPIPTRGMGFEMLVPHTD
jgi:hypothetical protein